MQYFYADTDVAEFEDRSIVTALVCEDESLAVQSQAEEADINTIVRRFGLTGQMPSSLRVPEYGDFSGISDYRQAIEAIREADRLFLALDLSIRERFGNDPARYVDFCLNPDNLAELREMGLAVPAPVVDPVVDPVVPPIVTE